MVDSAEDNSSSEQSKLICDICGVNQSSRGKKFTHPSHVWQHKKKRHREAVHQAAQSVSPLSVVKSLQKNQTGRHTRKVEIVNGNNPSQVKFCPHCGFHLAVVHAAMEFVNGDLSS